MVKAPLQVRWLLRGCPRCGGDLYSEGSELVCLQCGYHAEVKNADKRAKSIPVGTARIS